LFGGSGPGPTVTLRLHDPALYRKLALNPELYAGEAYMNVPKELGAGLLECFRPYSPATTPSCYPTV
jgi:cyclopropane-fatty-acyl-phospholipid synthase